ncbi:hypothetical protein D3C81_1864880 [compost metagenome]
MAFCADLPAASLALSSTASCTLPVSVGAASWAFCAAASWSAVGGLFSTSTPRMALISLLSTSTRRPSEENQMPSLRSELASKATFQRASCSLRKNAATPT